MIKVGDEYQNKKDNDRVLVIVEIHEPIGKRPRLFVCEVHGDGYDKTRTFLTEQQLRSRYVMNPEWVNKKLNIIWED